MTRPDLPRAADPGPRQQADLGFPTPLACTTDGCITCGDVAVALTVVDVGADGDARCRDHEGREETVAVDLVGPVQAGDRLLVHARVALERLEHPPSPEEKP